MKLLIDCEQQFLEKYRKKFKVSSNMRNIKL